MNWLTNYYFGEGKGIDKNAPKPTGLRLLAHVLGREWWELIKLNLLFIAFSLPLITLPAAYGAMVRISVEMIEDRTVYLWRDFWAAFRTGFVRTSVLGALLCGGGLLCAQAISTYATAAKASLAFAPPLAIALLVAVALPLFGAHLFAALGLGRDRPLRDVLRASAIGVLTRPLPGLAALAVVALLWLAHIWFYPVSVLLPVLVNFSLGALVTSFATLKGVRLSLAFCTTEPEDGAAARPIRS
ncbi:YesL family protein [Devosia sp.]|uniref:YesL family protein n=1 Tax=Devosia sp. TaxID=1871048 RepID=UPI0032653F67